MACIDFSELTPGAMVTRYDGHMYDAVETVMAVTGKSRKVALKDVGRLGHEKFESTKLVLLKFPGKGTGKTYTVHISNLVEFIMVLPGKAATSYRQKFADIVTRYLAGDASMHAEIQANAASSAPICEMAREALEVGDSQVGEKRAAVEDELGWASEGAGALVKRLREAEDMVTGIHPTLASMRASAEGTVVAIQATADAMERIVRLKKECCDIDEQGRAREMLDAGKRADFEASVRAREREDILAKARADAEALAIVADAKRKVSCPATPGPYQNVAEYLPDDHTTVELVYNESPGLQVRKKDKAKHLNEAKLEVQRLFRAEFAGAVPRKVMCCSSNRLVDMYPKAWTGVRAVLAGMARLKNGGLGQTSIPGCFASGRHIHVHLAK